MVLCLGRIWCSAFTTSKTGMPVPTSAAQFNLTFTVPGSPVGGDRWNFVTTARGNDVNTQKLLYFGPSASTFNSGRSMLEVAPGAVFEAIGVSSAPTLVDWLSSASTFYTFVDSGTLRMSNAMIQHADEQGLQLSGAGGVSLSSVTFDYSGTLVSSNNSNYITARSLTSAATFYAVVFNDSWSSGTAGSQASGPAPRRTCPGTSKDGEEPVADPASSWKIVGWTM